MNFRVCSLIAILWVLSAPAFAQTADSESDGSVDASSVEPTDEQDGQGVRQRLLWADVANVVAESAPTVTVADMQVRQAELRRVEARLAALPSLNMRFGMAPAPRVSIDLDENGSPIYGSADQTDAELATSIVSVGIQGSLEATLPLTTFGKIRLARQLADVGIDVEQARREVVVLEALFEAYRAYTALQWYDEVHALTVEAEDRLDEAEENLEDAIFDGDSEARSTLRRLTIGRTAFVQLQSAAETVGRVSEFALSTLLGLEAPLRLEPFVEDVSDEAPPTLQDVLAYARVHRPDYRLLNSAVRASQLRVRLEARQFAPDIAMIFNVGGAWAPTITNLRGPFIYDPYNRFGLGVALGMRWSGNPFMRTASVARFNEQAAQAVASRDAAWFGIEVDVTQAYYEALARRDVVLSFVDAREAAEAWMNQAAFQYDQGLSTFDDLREPLQTYYETAARYYQAVLEYQLGVADLAVKCGSRDMTQWPALSQNPTE